MIDVERANGLAANLDKKQRNFDKVIPPNTIQMWNIGKGCIGICLKTQTVPKRS